MKPDVAESGTGQLLLGDLRLLAQAAEHGSLAAVARAQTCSKASVTRQLQRLEAAVGQRLLHRGTGRFALTEEGRELLLKLREPLQAIDEAMLELSRRDGVLAGRLRIAAPYTFGRAVVAPMLASFLARHPAVTVQLELSSRKVDVLADEADVAIRVGDPGNAQLVARRLASDQVLLCAAPGYLDQHAPISRLSELSGHALLDFRPPPASGGVELVDADGRLRRILPAATPLRCNEPEVLVTAARAGAGIAIVPERFAAEALARDDLRIVLPGCGLPPLDIHAIYAPGRRQASRIRAFLDHLLAQSALRVAR